MEAQWNHKETQCPSTMQYITAEYSTVQLMHIWSELVPRWCPDGVRMVSGWCLGGAQLVFKWASNGAQIVHRWCQMMCCVPPMESNCNPQAGPVAISCAPGQYCAVQYSTVQYSTVQYCSSSSRQPTQNSSENWNGNRRGL